MKLTLRTTEWRSVATVEQDTTVSRARSRELIAADRERVIVVDFDEARWELDGGGVSGAVAYDLRERHLRLTLFGGFWDEGTLLSGEFERREGGRVSGPFTGRLHTDVSMGQPALATTRQRYLTPPMSPQTNVVRGEILDDGRLHIVPGSGPDPCGGSA